MNLAYKYPIIFWDCACLISDSGVSEEDGMTDYTKIAQALGIIQTANISISPVNINRSEYIFKPDVKNSTIMFGLGALSGLNQETIQTIEVGRPYISIADFMNRCPLNKTAMFSLIRAGAFDETDAEWSQKVSPVEPRKAIMAYYISQVSEPKKKLNLQNFSTLLQRGLVPEALDFQKRVFNFNKYLKERKYETYYIFDAPCEKFYNSYFDTELLEVVRGAVAIPQKKWDKIYSAQMDAAREWLKNNQNLVLNELNTQLFKECWDKYADGTVSAWEMKAMCYYYHPHELINIDTSKYGLVDFNSLSADPDVDYYFKRNGKEIPIFKTYKIIGTVIGKNDNKSSISLLTTTGVVNVKFTKEYYAMYNRQISEVQDDGSKKVAEKGWFSRGVMLLITGFRREDTFVAKSYKHTATHQIYRITEINGKDIVLEHERATEKI